MAGAVRRLGALVLLVAGLVGVPAALVALGGNPLPGSVSWAALRSALLRPDDGTVLVGLVTLIGWAAWLVFALSVLAELVTLLSGARMEVRLPGLAGPQRMVAGLLLTALAVAPVLAALPAHAEPVEAPPTPGPTRERGPAAEAQARTHGPPASTPTAQPVAQPADQRTDHPRSYRAAQPGAPAHPAAAADDRVRHVVRSGDDLWSLAEEYYGEGRDWRRIAAANPHVLSGGPDRLQPGWTLSIPGASAPDPAGTVRVRPGDTLSGIAEHRLGDASRWPALYAANRAQLADPDELAVGMRLSLPTRDADPGETEADLPTAKGSTARERGKTSSEPETDDPRSDRHPAEDRRASDRSGERPNREAAEGKTADGKTGDGRAGEPKTGDRPTADRPTADRPTGDRDRADRQRNPEQAAPQAGGAGRAGAPARPPATAEHPPPPVSDAPVPTSVTARPAPPTTPAAVDLRPAEAPPRADASRDDWAAAAAGLAGTGAFLAAGLIAALARRRRLQLQARPVGRRIVHPSGPAHRVEAALGRQQQPMGLRTLDLALRGMAAHCLSIGIGVPRLSLAAVAEDHLELLVAEGGPAPTVPGFTGSDCRWRLDQPGLQRLRSAADLGDTLRPFPALVTLGRDDRDRTVLADLESLGLLALAPADKDGEDGADGEHGEDGADGEHGEHREHPETAAMLNAMALELACSPWTDEMVLTLVGEWPDLAGTFDQPNLTGTDDLDQLLDRLERRADEQREHRPTGPRGHERINPDLADPWAPEVVLIRAPLSADQGRRLFALSTREPRPTIAVVTAGPVPGAPWTLRLPTVTDSGAEDLPPARLEPLGLDLVHQWLAAPAVEQVLELVGVTAGHQTTPAPWWVIDEPEPPPANVTDLDERVGAWGTAATTREVETVTMQGPAGFAAGDRPPLLQLLGPVELHGATGTPPPRAAKQCLEYCGWLLEHPGTSAQAMASALVVAEGTRRSNMSRLRTWLGSDPSGDPYLPDAYTGRIALHPSVSSDWHQVQILTAPAVNRAGDAGLRMALELVHGAPLADAAPGQWHWAEELRTDMISVIRDIGVELATRALTAGDFDLARWAAARALAAAPGDELLLATRVRTEHLAGNASETERLTLHLVAQSRALGVDLDPTTVALLQQVMEGRVRARLA